MKIKKSLKIQNFDTDPHARCQKRGVPEEAKIGRTITRIEFFTCALGAPRSAYLPYAVSAAEQAGWAGLCTHGKDLPGLGKPNSLTFFIYLT